MRLAFWRAGEHKAGNENTVAQRVVSTPASAESGDLDLRALGQALVRNKGWIIVPTLLAAVLSIAAVNLITPRYKFRSPDPDRRPRERVPAAERRAQRGAQRA